MNDRMQEGIDYELIPVEYIDHDQAWDIRILLGPFTETVIRYGTIRIDGVAEELRFDFRVVESPDLDVTSEDLELQKTATYILEDILERGMKEGWVHGKESKDLSIDGNTIGTDDSEESTD